MASADVEEPTFVDDSCVTFLFSQNSAFYFANKSRYFSGNFSHKFASPRASSNAEVLNSCVVITKTDYLYLNFPRPFASPSDVVPEISLQTWCQKSPTEGAKMAKRCSFRTLFYQIPSEITQDFLRRGLDALGGGAVAPTL